jgi:hypothetical protein
MATLKNMTRVGADVRQIARLLQAKAPENHMLAYITPEEAQLLKDRGGSGMPDPETGVPSFAPAYDYEATGLKEDTLARLGLGGIQAIIGARASKKAADQGQRGRQEMEALAAPYLQKGAELQRQAQAGELTPVARQQLEASQAQAAQAASARGGVGAQQTAARIEALRSQLLQQQYDYGLKLSGIGDQISLGAIKTGLQADQVVNQMTNSYYNNIMRTLMPQPKYVIAGQPNVTTE